MPETEAHSDPVHPDARLSRWLPEGWSWGEPRHGEHFRRCTWCGSIHPEDLAAEETWIPEWADRKYGYPHKFYVLIPNRDRSRLYVLSSANFRPDHDRYRHYDELSEEERRVEGVRPGDWYDLGPRDHHFAKFYTKHLADPSVSVEAREEIERRGGLRFTFQDGKVWWRPYEEAEGSDA